MTTYDGTRRGFLRQAMMSMAIPMLPATSARDESIHLLEAAETAVRATDIRSARSLLRAIPPARAADFRGSLELWRRFLSVQAVTLRDSGLGHAAVPVYGRVARLAQRAGDPVGYGVATIGSIISLMNEGRVRSAERLFSRDHARLATVDDPILQIELAFWQARLLEDGGHIAAAREVAADRVMPLSTAHETVDMQVARYVFTCRLALRDDRPDWRTAERQLVNAETILGRQTRALRMGQFFTTRALFEERTGNHEEARTLALRATRTFATVGIESPPPRAVLTELNEPS
jgi:hypothetical protein